MKQILLLTDFSDNSWNALFMAVKLYAKWECEFHILHTFEPDNWQIVNNGKDGMEIVAPEHQDLIDQMDGTKEYLLKNHQNPKHVFSTLLIAGGLVETVQRLVPKYDLDLVVLGTHGKTGSKTVFAGNSALRVMRQVINCHLLLVPGSHNFQKLDKVSYPTEFSHFTPKYVLTPLLELLGQWKSTMHIIHVALEFHLTEEQKTNKEILKKRFADLELLFDQVSLSKSVTWDILEKTNSLESDMIVITKYSHSVFETFLHEPILKKLGSRTRVPIWISPDFQPYA
ncbi:universal stress protein [Muricauda sp. 334s03]|uniref:Universal stress protein n=1 Tax=Flagellimonas yonaguniensis TaxID=3031325 RepID=A0ABT5XY36_9FLAO|nr:universal stress protein [[Muricauda] yonaguniensis]MDF0716102.1 universal stress protein [[Muricauda] yonaguniensis]